MEAETLDLPELARYLNRDLRDLEKLAAKGRLPGRRVGGKWTVHRSEVHTWLERGVGDLSTQELAHMESALGGRRDDLVATSLLTPERISLKLDGRTAPGVLQSLVQLANSDWQVYDPQRVLALVRDRESAGTTALQGGIAVPHPARRLPDLLGDSIVAFGRAPGGIPFGDPSGKLTDLFFLVLCRDDITHLRVLARLARLFHVEGLLDALRAAQDTSEVMSILVDAESEVD